MTVEEAIKKYTLVNVLGNSDIRIVDTDQGPIVIFARTALPLRYFDPLIMYATLSCNPSGDCYTRIARNVIDFWEKYSCRPEDCTTSDTGRYAGYIVYSWFRGKMKDTNLPKEIKQYYNDHREAAFWDYLDKREQNA